MIIHDHNAVFVHVPKTAGVSMTHAIIECVSGFKPTGGICDLPRYLAYGFGLEDDKRHYVASDYVPAAIRQDQWDEYYKFAFCRNPFDRTVSHYCWRKGALHGKAYPGNFRDFVLDCDGFLRGRPNKDSRWPSRLGPAVLTQKRFVTREGKPLLDDVFRFEDLAQAIPKIAKRTGMKIDLGHHNASKRKKWEAYYSDETESIVRSLYAEDFEYFGY